MKKVAAYSLFLIYIIATAKTALPLVVDGMAHFFWKAHHIATIHHHYGNHHVENEIADNDHHDDDDQNGGTIKYTEPAAIHIAAKISCTLHPLFFKEQKYNSLLLSFPTTYLELHYPPPKA